MVPRRHRRKPFSDRPSLLGGATGHFLVISESRAGIRFLLSNAVLCICKEHISLAVHDLCHINSILKNPNTIGLILHNPTALVRKGIFGSKRGDQTFCSSMLFIRCSWDWVAVAVQLFSASTTVSTSVALEKNTFHCCDFNRDSEMCDFEIEVQLGFRYA